MVSSRLQRRLALPALLFAALAASAAGAAAQGVHQDDKLGYKLRPPREFTAVPLKPDEEWIVARWLSDKAYYQNDPTTGYQHDQKPELHVIAFPDAKTQAERVEVTKKTDADKAITLISFKNPFKDYRDYLKRTYSEGGYYVDKEEKSEVEGVAVECLEIKVEKMTWGGPRRIVTWIFDAPAADYAVQFEMFESAFPKLKKDVLSTMRSFRLIAGTGGIAAMTGKGAVVTDLDRLEADWDKLTPSQRMMKKLEIQQQDQERAAEGLTGGWKAKRYGRCFVLYDVDEKAVQRFTNDANAVLDYLDDQFPWLNPDEFVRDPTLRICKDRDEEQMYRKGSGGWSWGQEIVTHKDLDRGGSWSEGGWVNSRVCEHWFRERSSELWDVLPIWLRVGLDEAFQKTRSKGKKLEFFDDSWERVDIAEQIRAGKLLTLRELIEMDSDALYSDRNRWSECSAAARFFITGPRKAEDALKTYLQALEPLAKKREEERKKALEANAKSDRPKTEEEEDAAFRAAHQKMDDSEKKFLAEASAKAFGGWSDSDWKSLDAAYKKSIK